MVGDAVEQRGGHLRVAEHGGPLAEGEVGGDDDRGLLVELADQVEQELPAGSGERQITQFIEHHEIESAELGGDGSGFADTRLFLEPGDEIDRVEVAPTGTVTKVIYTHAHPDHLWGTLGADGKSVFPNASFHVAEAEWNFWVTPDLASKMPKDMEGMVKTTQSQLAAIKDKVAMFKSGAEVLPGINVLDTAGHTPGHVSFELAGGDGLIITGDAITNPQIFFAHPDWKFGFDADPATAIANRKKLLDMASTEKKKLLGYHWPYPGIGMAEAKDGAYVYVPVN